MAYFQWLLLLVSGRAINRPWTMMVGLRNEFPNFTWSLFRGHAFIFGGILYLFQVGHGSRGETFSGVTLPPILKYIILCTQNFFLNQFFGAWTFQNAGVICFFPIKHKGHLSSYRYNLLNIGWFQGGQRASCFGRIDQVHDPSESMVQTSWDST